MDLMTPAEHAVSAAADMADSLPPTCRPVQGAWMRAFIAELGEQGYAIVPVSPMGDQSERYTAYYTSQDLPGGDSPWSVYSEEYPSPDSDNPIDGTQRWVARRESELEAELEADRLFRLSRRPGTASPMARTITVHDPLNGEVDVLTFTQPGQFAYAVERLRIIHQRDRRLNAQDVLS